MSLMRILGPGKSPITVRGLPKAFSAFLIQAMRSIASSRVAWEKLIRNTSTPAFANSRIACSVCDAGPIVATIFTGLILISYKIKTNYTSN